MPAAHSLSRCVDNMSCPSCVGRVERALCAAPGVTQANVNLASLRTNVTYVNGAITPDDIAAIALQGGHAASLHITAQGTASADARKDAETATLRRDLIVAAALTLPVFVLETGAPVPRVSPLADGDCRAANCVAADNSRVGRPGAGILPQGVSCAVQGHA